MTARSVGGREEVGPVDRQTAFTGTKNVPERLRFDPARLAAFLAGAIPGLEGPVEVTQFKGGQSNPTYLLRTPTARYVLRRKPPGTLLPSAHAIEREYRVMKALGDVGFPVPRVLVLCEDASVVGTPFFVMERVDGRVLWDPLLPGLPPTEREAIYDNMNGTLARLHRLDPTAIGLADYGKPHGYVARQIARWSRQYEASKTAAISEMDRLAAWLPDRVPPQQGAAVVHGDYRLDNLILAGGEPEVRAVLDWELSTLGDPIADFAYHLMAWEMPITEAGTGSLKGAALEELGIPCLGAYVAAYEQRTGFEVRDHLDFYFAYNFFRLAAILQGIVGRVRDGTATSDRPYTIDSVRPLAATAWRFAERASR